MTGGWEDEAEGGLKKTDVYKEWQQAAKPAYFKGRHAMQCSIWLYCSQQVLGVEAFAGCANGVATGCLHCVRISFVSQRVCTCVRMGVCAREVCTLT